MDPIFTIVTPVFNRPEVVCATIESVLKQTFHNWEYLIIDDLSTDNTWEVIAEYAKKNERINALKRNRSPKGAQTCRNIGVQHSRGKYILFLDSDDILMPFCLKQRYDFVKTHPYTDFAVFPKNKIKSHEANNLLISFLSYKLLWQIMDPLWSKSFLNQIGGFDERIPRFQDVELSIKALLHDNVNLVISDEHTPDSRYLYNSRLSQGNDHRIVFDGMKSLIPRTLTLLEDSGRADLKPYLRFYLRSWLIHYHAQEYSPLTNELTNYFSDKGIISNKLSNLLILFSKFNHLAALNLKLPKKVLYHLLFAVK